MGDRSAIRITSDTAYNGDTDTTIYGHWAGTTNLIAVQNVLSEEHPPIGDQSRLTAQLFHEFATVLGNYDGGSGYRIISGNSEVWTDNPTVIINADTGEYTMKESD